MRKLTCFLLFGTLFLSLLSFKSLAQSSGITGEQVVAKSWKAMFGDVKQSEIQTIYFESFFHGSTIPSKIYIHRPNLFRNENKSGILVYDGKKAAWVERVPDEEGNPQGPELIEEKYWCHFEVDIAIAFPAYFDLPYKYLGIEELDEGSAYIINVILPLGGEVKYYINTNSFLVVRRMVMWEPGHDFWENIIPKYNDIDGYNFPDGYIFEGRNGQERGFYRNVQFNQSFREELFQLPDILK